MLPKFTLDDAQDAWEAWGCNCGPTALAVMMGMTLDEVRPHLQGFDAKRYTNPTMMFDALKSIGRRWWKIGTEWPAYGLARIQWEGPWTEPGVPMRVRYRHTHWVAGWYTVERGYGVYDCNAMANGTGWVRRSDWERTMVPFILMEVPRANGKWHVTHGIEVERPQSRFQNEAAECEAVR